MKSKGTKDGNISIYCPYKSGIFSNGRIHSFCELEALGGTEEYTANKDCTNYGPYYDGVDWDHNFAELFTDRHLKIYSVIDNAGKKYKIGDFAPSISGGTLLITGFYIEGGQIDYKGIESKLSLGILGFKGMNNDEDEEDDL